MISIPTADVHRLAANMRPMDQAECVLKGFLPVEALKLSIAQSTYCRGGYDRNGSIQAAWGLVPTSPLWNAYRPWMLMTEWPEHNIREFWAMSKQLVPETMALSSYLENEVHVDNIFSIRWLSKLGFDIHEPVGSWRKFTWEKQNVHELTAEPATSAAIA